MAYSDEDLYSTRHAATIETLKSPDFAASSEWVRVISSAKQCVVADGFDAARYSACTGIRKRVSEAEVKDKIKPVDTMLTAAGVTSLPTSGSKSIPAPVAKRVAALEVLRHLWLLKTTGSHKLWVLSLPESYKAWPDVALAGKAYDSLGAIVNDGSAHFSVEDRKHLAQATQTGLAWLQKAMVVASSPKKAAHMVILKRWFADANSKDADMETAAAALKAGLKKIAACIKSNFVLICDMPLDRGNAARANVNAFVFSGEAINAIYVEPAFFSKRDMFKDLKNWTRIVVHELSHRMVKTKDHRYRHHASGLKPDTADAKFTAAHALDNADSWALFCMDCAGQLVEADYKRLKVDV